MFMCNVFCFKQKTAYEMRISDWSSDVCSSDLSAQQLVEVASRRQHEQVAADLAKELAADGRLRLAPHSSQLPASSIQLDDGTAQIGRASCRERGCQYV